MSESLVSTCTRELTVFGLTTARVSDILTQKDVQVYAVKISGEYSVIKNLHKENMPESNWL